MKYPVWTTELGAAVRAIAIDDRPQDPSRRDLAADIRGRAQEFAQWAQPGIPLTQTGVAMMQALRSRLNDPFVDFKPASEDLERAWGRAWAAAEEREPIDGLYR